MLRVNKLAEITQKWEKSHIFIVTPKQRKQLKVISTTYKKKW